LELGRKVERVQKVFKEAKKKFNPPREERMIKVELPEDEIPTSWYNIQADLHKCGMKLPFPTGPGMANLPLIFPPSLLSQELTKDRWVKIPEELMEIYRIWRPTPLYRCKRLEEYLKTPARIYCKSEYVSPPGSHKPNTAVAQAYFNMKDGFEGVTTETGAGQWGSGLCFGAALVGIKCDVFMVRVSYYQKPGRRVMMESWGGRVVPSPSAPPERIYEDMVTETAKKALAEDPNHPGSLGWAISEAIEHALKKPYPLNYSLGSVLNHVLMHQTIVGLEAYKQYELIDEYPDIIFGCTGGGSNHCGQAFPFIKDKLDGKKPDLRIVACEALSCPRLTRPKYIGYDTGDTIGYTPHIWMHSLGCDFVPAKIHAGGLRYHGMAPLLCVLIYSGYHEAQAFPQTEIFEAGRILSMTEGFLTAPETCHCWTGAIREARRCAETGEEKVIHVADSGHGWVDVRGYDEYLKGKLEVLL